jgi:hypothetical protein
MMATISFKEIVKLIHPDHNPGITDAGAKMALAVSNRLNETMLHSLGVRWGVIKVATTRQSPRTHTHTAPPRPEAPKTDDYTIFRRANRIFQPGDIVYCRTKGCSVKITRVSDTRVYFIFNGKESYAAKKNVRFM